ncbi:MAG: 2Fe-2S iron-sulfur cluster-binding protein [Planctomycetota bacterium]
MTYHITFQPMGKTVEVDPDSLQEPRDGLRGGLLQIALDADVGIDHACGGIAACSTCHVIVQEGGDSIPEASDDEEDMLDSAPGLTLKSRLACQAVPDGSQDLVVEIPSWNRNLVKE